MINLKQAIIEPYICQCWSKSSQDMCDSALSTESNMDTPSSSIQVITSVLNILSIIYYYSTISGYNIGTLHVCLDKYNYEFTTAIHRSSGFISKTTRCKTNILDKSIKLSRRC